MMDITINLLSLIVLIWSICSADESNKTLTEVCSHLCPGPLGNSSVVKQLCEDHVILDRCCLNISTSSFHDEDVLGIDLSGCDLHQLNNSLQHFPHVITVVLDDNPLKQKNVDDNQFYGLSLMDYLSLPSGLACPGGNESWEITKSLPQRTLCQGQLDQCAVDNFTCPHHSHCLPQGPGLKDCLCDDGYHGYKCLRHVLSTFFHQPLIPRWESISQPGGQFPTEWCLIGLCCTTVAVSTLLWCTQRRHDISRKQR